MSHSRFLEDAATKTHRGECQGVDLEIDGQHDGTRWNYPGDRRRASRALAGGARVFDDQTEPGELADEVSDRRTIEPGLTGETGSGQRPGEVEPVEDRGEIVSPQLLG
jgi:hypothetical protein